MAVSENCPGWKRLLVTLVQNDPEQDGALPTYDVTGGMADVELIAGKFILRVCPGLLAQPRFSEQRVCPQTAVLSGAGRYSRA